MKLTIMGPVSLALLVRTKARERLERGRTSVNVQSAPAGERGA